MNTDRMSQVLAPLSCRSFRLCPKLLQVSVANLPGSRTKSVSLTMAVVLVGIAVMLLLMGWTLSTDAASQVAGVAIGPSHTRQANAGESILYNHILTNTGTLTDTFLLQVASTRGWPVALLRAGYPTRTLALPLQVGAQMTVSFQLSVTVPPGLAGITEITIITATSQTSPTVQAVAVDTTVVFSRIYLPLIFKPLPSPQESISITPTDNNYYIVSWSAVTGATGYILEEAADAGFSNPTQVYEGSNLSWSSPQRPATTLPCGATFYYRVKTKGTAGDSEWSNIQAVTIRIDFTYVPAYGSYDNVQGKVCGVNPADYKVAAYIYVVGKWWTKPYWDRPLTPIKQDGTFSFDYTTGGADEQATKIIAFLVPNSLTPPQDSFPDPGQYHHVVALRPSAARVITFSGCQWEVKSSNESPVGPGPNYFSDDPADVWVDGSGYLHLNIVHRSGKWYSTEVICADTLQYGAYTLALASRVDLLDKNVVLGFFSWDTEAPQYNYREIDIEFSRWGEDAAPNAQYVIQPWDVSGNRHRYYMNLTGTDSTHRFDWHPDRVQFDSWDESGSLLQSWTYTNTIYIPPAGAGNARINLWLLNGWPPSDSQNVEVIIKSFQFVPTNP